MASRKTFGSNDPDAPDAVNTARLALARSGYYEIRYSERDPDTGAWRSRCLSTRTQSRTVAQAALTSFMSGERQTKADEDAAHKPSVKELCGLYLHAKEKQGSTSSKPALSRLCRVLGTELAEDITATVLDLFCVQRRGTGLAEASIRKEISALLAALRWAVKRKLIPAEIVPCFDLPAQSAPRSLVLDRATEAHVHETARQWFTVRTNLPGERGIMRRARQETGLFVCLALNTAARRSAILGLTWDRIDLKRGLIDYRDPSLRATKKRRVPVPINGRLLPILQEAHARASTIVTTMQGRALGAVFISQSLHDPLARFAVAVGVPGLTPHVFRHTWATLTAQTGGSLYDIAGMLGDNPKTVIDNYLHQCPEHLRKIADHHYQYAGQDAAQDAAQDREEGHR